MEDLEAELLLSTFPNGYEKKATGVKGLPCGLHALILSMESMQPDLAPTPFSFQQIADSTQYKSQGVARPKPETRNNYSSDQLANILEIWGYQHGVTMKLACIEDNRSSTELVTPIPDAKSRRPLVVVWIHSDGMSGFIGDQYFSHYSGLVPVAVESSSWKGPKRPLHSQLPTSSQSQAVAPPHRPILPLRAPRITPIIQFELESMQGLSLGNESPPAKKRKVKQPKSKAPVVDRYEEMYSIIIDGEVYNINKYKTITNPMHFVQEITKIRQIIGDIRTSNQQHSKMSREIIEAIFERVIMNVFGRWTDCIYVYCPKYPFSQGQRDWYKTVVLYRAMDVMLTDEAEKHWVQEKKKDSSLEITTNRLPLFPRNIVWKSAYRMMHTHRCQQDRMHRVSEYRGGYPRPPREFQNITEAKADAEYREFLGRDCDHDNPRFHAAATLGDDEGAEDNPWDPDKDADDKASEGEEDSDDEDEDVVMDDAGVDMMDAGDRMVMD